MKLTSYYDANKVVGELFESLRSRYQRNLQNNIILCLIQFNCVLQIK